MISKKVKDARLIKLVYKFLKAGYMEHWKYNATYSGTPQGGVISPLLANIYLHELDKFVMMTLKTEFDKPTKQRLTKQYSSIEHKVHKLKKRIISSSGAERLKLIDKYKNLRKELLKTPYTSQTGKKIVYQRYAEYFLVGINGNRKDCLQIKCYLSEFISTVLKMKLSEEKTLIMHSSQPARFLGYNIHVRRNSEVRPSTRGTRRTLSNHVNLSVPFEDKIQKFIFSKGIAKYKDNSLKPVHRPALINCTDLEIISIYSGIT